MEREYPTARLQSLINTVQRLIHDGKISEAIIKAEEAVDFSKRHFGEQGINTASAYSTLGACYSKAGQDGQGRPMLEKALSVLSAQTEDCTRQVANVRNNLSAVCRRLHLPRQALHHALGAVEGRLRLWGNEHHESATSIGNLGHTLSYLGFVLPALKCYAIAAPYDTATRKSESNYQVLMKAIEEDERFSIAPNDYFSDDWDGLDLERIISGCRNLLREELDDELFLLKYGGPSHPESYSVFVSQLKIALSRYPQHETAPPAIFEIIRSGRQRLSERIRLPTHSGRILLKQIDRSKLGPLGQAALKYAFPNFSVDLEPRKKELGIERQYQSFNEIKLENLTKRYGAENITVSYTDRQYRRYAGDNNLPSGCYYSVCQQADGHDGQTLCRELYEYTDLEIPGFIWVSDSWDEELMAALKKVNRGEAAFFAPGIYVFMLPPVEEEKKPLYRRFYAPVLEQTQNWDGLSTVHIPTRLKLEKFEKIVDLRQKITQEWFCRFFERGDGGVFHKPVKETPKDFTHMLPALVYPEYGGSGVTKSVGSWMRLAGIDALVYPSARSNAGVDYDPSGHLSSFHGWNLVDYRKSYYVPDRQMHLDADPWYDFVAGRQSAPKLVKGDRSWRIQGSEDRYQWERKAFVDLIKHL